MKKIVSNQENTVLIDNINDDDIVGIKWGFSLTKSIIINTNEGFVGIGNDEDELTTTGCWSRSTKKEYVKSALAQANEGVNQAFIFNSVSELFKWMSE